jgi:hypothetical protein
MPRRRHRNTKLGLLADRIAEARRIIEAQQILLERLRVAKAPTREAEGALRTYASSLMHLVAHKRKLKEEAEAKKAKRNSKVGTQKLNRTR